MSSLLHHIYYKKINWLFHFEVVITECCDGQRVLNKEYIADKSSCFSLRERCECTEVESLQHTPAYFQQGSKVTVLAET